MLVNDNSHTQFHRFTLRLLSAVLLGSLVLSAGCTPQPIEGIELTGSFSDDVVVIRVPSLPQPTIDPLIGTAPSIEGTGTPDSSDDAQGQTALAAQDRDPFKSLSGPVTTWERVADIRVKPGDSVTTGQVIAVLDDSRVSAVVAAAAADLARAEADLAYIESRTGDVVEGRSEAASQTVELQLTLVDLELQRRDLQAQLDAARTAAAPPSNPGTGTVPPLSPEIAASIARLELAIAQIDNALEEIQSGLEELQKAQLELQNAESSLQAVQRTAIAVVDARRAILGVVQAQLEAATVVAPRDGVVVEAVARGEVRATGAPLVTLRTLARPLLTTYVTSEQARQFRDGSPARIRIDSLPQEEFTGVVTLIGSEYEVVPTTFSTKLIHLARALRVTVEVYGAPDLPPGTPADLLILTD